MRCEFKLTLIPEDGLYHGSCTICGRSVRSTSSSPSVECTGKKESVISKLRKPLKYVTAVKNWLTQGRPVRSPEAVEFILENICKPCEFYSDGRCNECGCRINKSENALGNKIRMATEDCPKGKWPEVRITEVAGDETILEEDL